jgi:hypothetical protein
MKVKEMNKSKKKALKPEILEAIEKHNKPDKYTINGADLVDLHKCFTEEDVKIIYDEYGIKR